MDEQYGLMIVGGPAASAAMAVTAPWDGSQIAIVQTGDERHVDHALTVAQRLFHDRDHWLTLHQRVEILERTAELMKEERDELAFGASREGGKPLCDSREEVTRAIDGVKRCVETIRTEQGHVVPIAGTEAGARRLAFTQKEPIGPVVAVSAFNHPLNLIVHQVAAAVAAGCPVIVKPAEDTPLSCIRFVQRLQQAGLPPQWCQVLVASEVTVAEKLVTDPRVAFFSFIGSARVGWMLRSKLAPGTRCALEHGGAAPVIVARDADFGVALPALLKGGFYHAGQVCVSVQRVFVHAGNARDFAQRLAAGAMRLRTLTWVR